MRSERAAPIDLPALEGRRLSWPWCWLYTYRDGFYARKQPCFQRVLAIAILSVCLSHGWIRQKRSKLGSPNLHHRLPGRL